MRQRKLWIRKIRTIDETIEVFEGHKIAYLEQDGTKLSTRTTDTKVEIIEEFREMTMLEMDLFNMRDQSDD